jgi:hypothetical protein
MKTALLLLAVYVALQLVSTRVGELSDDAEDSDGKA